MACLELGGNEMPVPVLMAPQGITGRPGGAPRRAPLPPAKYPLTLCSLCPDITGPIILQTYRAIADYEKSSGSEMALAMGDVVDVVEKGESGQSPTLPGPSSPAAWARGHEPPPRLCSGALTVLPPPRSACFWGRCGHLHTGRLRHASLGAVSGWAGQLLIQTLIL